MTLNQKNRVPKIFNPILLGGLSFILIISLVGLYIFQLSAITEAKYVIKNYSQKIEALSEENRALEIKFSQLDSLENLRSLVKNLGFKEVKQVHYLEIPAGAVVAR